MNPYEAANRTKKAYALAAHLHKFAITAEEAESMTYEQWVDVAMAAKLKEPGKDGVTIREAIEALRKMERPRPIVEELLRRCAS